MDELMRYFAPKGAIGFLLRFIILVGIVAALDVAFEAVLNKDTPHDPLYYILHAAFVGGPLIAFFLAVISLPVQLQRKLWRSIAQQKMGGHKWLSGMTCLQGYTRAWE